MPNTLIWFTGNRNPSISETITNSDGTVKNLTGLAVRFKCRQPGSSTLLVDQPVSNVLDATGFVRYDWSAADITGPSGALFSERELLIWWEVTEGGKTQDVNEYLIQVYAHAPQTNTYLELEELKATLELTGWTGTDTDLRAALLSASRAVDDMTQTRFFTTTSDEVRYYTPDAAHVLFTDEINMLTELAIAAAAGTTFTAWTLNTDFMLEPLNAALDNRPWHTVRTASRTARCFYPYQRSVRITGKFGWTAPPEAVRVATGIIATKIVKRAKDAPMGVLTFFDGSAVRLSRFDPQVEELLAPYNRATPFP